MLQLRWNMKHVSPRDIFNEELKEVNILIFATKRL